ncbi:AlpA family transcriptional regulator [Sulfitobacter sp. W074]|uniref:helix-turn-helix transcriptional regulator n=1 Tax=Sulfitobacter sp. W074 TaxID=2867026 RepID=UPI0021A5880E|nr:DNA-binding protein [Sulfitobacter sp. W074]UWR37672.1 DNA-binding protein [Sulfitobacter sp. W074]
MTLTAEFTNQNGPHENGTVCSLVAKDPLIRDADGAFMMGCSKATFWRRVADGTVPAAIKIGGMSRWRLSDIEAVISKAEANRAPSAA